MINENKFNNLTETNEPHAISLYLPVTRTDKDRITMKNLLSDVSGQLKDDYGLDARDVDARIENLHQKQLDERWFEKDAKGLAIFDYGDTTECILLDDEIDEKAYVGDQLYVQPLTYNGLENSGNKMYLLKLSANDVDLFTVTSGSIKKHERSGELPQMILDAVGHDVEQKALQFRSGKANSGNGNLYHGHGAGNDTEKKTEYMKFFREIDHKLTEIIDDQHTPLVLACVDYLYPIFTDIANYNNIYEKPISGNHDHTDTQELFEACKEIMDEAKRCELMKQREQFQENLNLGHSSYNEEDVIAAAIEGRVNTLFVDKDAEIYGIYDAQNYKVRIDDDRSTANVSLTNMAVIHTIKNGGQVIATDSAMTPEHKPLSANFRYAYEQELAE
ncbi:MAG: hypothetical protein WBA74_26725 [Cyclobacteriaceae bacterium]